jgi:pyruvate dehydrogenase E1 component alpha subunit
MAEVVPQPSDAELVAMLEQMIAARVYSSRLFNLQRQGRVGTMAPIDGNEAAVVGTVAALDVTTDWVVPQYREPVALGGDGDEVIDAHTLYLMGHPAGGRLPDHVKVVPIQISLAAQLPHALGLAWGLQLRGEPGVVAAFFGDGASSEGDFYEAANFAGVLRAPVLFILVNNHWAISTPASHQTAAVSFADKAVAAGFPGVQVDGRDPVAVREVVSAARARAVAGEGPTLVECVTYRLGPHTTADDPTRYVPPDEVAAERERDPVSTFGARLRELDLWSDADDERARAEALARVDLAFERAQATAVEEGALFEHVFAEPTPRLRRQREASAAATAPAHAAHEGDGR